jgi:hypothetical protein
MGNLAHVDHGKFTKTGLKLAQAGADDGLSLFGGMVLGILAEVTELAGAQDFFGEFIAQFVFERVDLILNFFLENFHADYLIIWNYLRESTMPGW